MLEGRSVVRMRMISSVFRFILVLLASTLCACIFDQGNVVIVFVDLSGSSLKHRDIYRNELTLIKRSLSGGDRLVVAPITDKSLTEFELYLDVELPVYRFWKHNHLAHDQKMDAVFTDIEQRISSLLAGDRNTPHTDILNTLSIAEKIFGLDQRRRTLIFMSDMLEDSADYDFNQLSLTDDIVFQIIEEQKMRDTLPNLTGVRAVVTGASAKTARKAQEVERFWRAYLTEVGAIVQNRDYGPRLFNFSL